MGEERTKRPRDNEAEAAENSRKAARMDQDNIIAAGDDEVDLGGAKADGLSNVDLKVVKGMTNLGNTCYLNALVQCLLALGKLRKILLKPKAKLGLMGMALKDLVVKTSTASNTGNIMDPAFVTACIRAWNATFKGTEMQDSQELFLSVISRLGKEEKEVEEPSNSPHLHDRIDLMFGGEICFRNYCSCSKVTSDYKPFDDLALPMPTEEVQGNHPLALIEDCLKLYFKEEKIHFCCSSKPVLASASCSTVTQTAGDPETVEENLPNCLSAEKQVSLLCAKANQNEDLQHQDGPEEATVNEGATRAIFITKLPQVLVLYLQRYSMHSDGITAIKLSGHVSFEELLNVGQFMEPSCEETNSIYYLAGVIEHIGSTPTSGHYVSYVKSKADGWFRVTDHVTKQISLQEVLQCEAYMLFYERG